MKLRTIVFSKDRAMQLHATLFSFAARCGDAHESAVSVIYKASSSGYKAAYAHLRQEIAPRLKVEWIDETDFKNDLIAKAICFRRRNVLDALLQRPTAQAGENVLFLVDDNIFISEFRLLDVTEALSSQTGALGFSLRIGKNTTYCYPNRCDQALPKFVGLPGNILRFTWPKQEGDFGYPLEVSSSVYRAKDLEFLLRKLPYANPNRLEQGLSMSSRLFARSKPDLLCFERSVAFCVPVNKVQSVLDNRAGNESTNSVEELNKLFLDGFRIDFEKLRGFVPRGAHQELDLPLAKSAA
jgi:hypothetical protein